MQEELNLRKSLKTWSQSLQAFRTGLPILQNGWVWIVFMTRTLEKDMNCDELRWLCFIVFFGFSTGYTNSIYK